MRFELLVLVGMRLILQALINQGDGRLLTEKEKTWDKNVTDYLTWNNGVE